MQQKQPAGFTLIELAVVLVIIAMIVGTSFVAFTNNINIVKTKQTREKLVAIEKALLAFVIENKRLPCPADGSLAQSNASFGVEDFNSGTSVCNSTAPLDTTNVVSGVVPVESLLLPYDYMVDGWGRRISYAIDSRLGGEDIGTASFYETDETSLDVAIAEASIMPNVAYVIFSHGANGHGAWLENGSARFSMDSDPSESEYENCHLDGSLTADPDYNGTFVQWANEAGFDDVLIFNTKRAFMLEMGGLFGDEKCTGAVSLLEENGTICDNSENKNACIQLVMAVKDRCVFTP